MDRVPIKVSLTGWQEVFFWVLVVTSSCHSCAERARHDELMNLIEKRCPAPAEAEVENP